MQQQIRGIVHGRQIELERETGLPDGANVTVQIDVVRSDETSAIATEDILALAERCAIDGPPDLAGRHDHYAHGKPTK